MFKHAWDRCRSNLTANVITGIFISTILGLVCWSYYQIDPFGKALDRLGELKQEFGYFYSSVTTAFFGGIIPYTILVIQKNIPTGKKKSWFLFFVVFWAIKGIEVDAFYRLQGIFYGDENQVQEIFYKVMTDMLIYCPFWSAPVTAIFYGWKKAGFEWAKVREVRSFNRLLSESAFLLFSTWIIWIPAVTIVYTMPTNLQIPCFNLTLCFFVVVISYLQPIDKVAG